ncbi:LEAF RUST 10 DISEASE-RESISTANCE LOCUS RECEPTOR-LIKE PROTEIN KINASE-like 1.2 isoform X2 [Quercus robur]|uniref:LEAF RUST 10 DISEASE-RESISTANCE LOCUS RECEPTOR-LIKE PROTEIN KINASE-like 1.2 isoform X2 n=1 Tax=Quercus robur TaxID=38942 RepID=UPI0021631544|nr:LEAF RUST 10 DISEASE-RESISTANCE LOCUS RECEPTOR-LIKE PROTEIN KINASE-like 1.2 isoform X2 [Quercus robur]
MSQTNLLPTLLSPISRLIILCILFFSLVPKKSLGAVDPYFQSCSVPKTCGDGQAIRFPFYIQDKQNSSCGYPGFNLSCNNNGHPNIVISNNNYTIHEIFYQNETLRVSNSAFSNPISSCIPSINSISLPGSRFDLAPNQTNLFLFYNCSSSVHESWPSEFYPSCYGENGTVLALSGRDSKLISNVSMECKSKVLALVEAYGGGIGKSLRNGFVLKWKASNCSICEDSGGNCGFDNIMYHFKCFCPDRPHAWNCPGNSKRVLVIGFATGCSALIIFLVIGVATWVVYTKKHASQKLLSKTTYSDRSSRSDLEGGSVYFGIPVFSYTELEEATNNFDIEKELGDGGFGTVYHGKLRDGREVAVKRLYEHNYRRVEQFLNEVKILTRLHHKNLVSLYGCTSRHSRELLLVYEFVPKGTVADHIHGDRATPGSLKWATRLSIAIETASALAYLHASDIIHRDVKTNNILLDDNFCVKVADFGLSRLFPNDVTHVSTAPQGTPGYVDPEYHQCYQLTSKSDVYSFGVVLIELISSLPAVDMARHRPEINLANLAINKIEKCAFHELIDPHLGFESDNEVKRMAMSVAELAFQCIQEDKEMRPSMDEVLEALKKIQSGNNDPEEKAYDDAGILNVQQTASPDCDEVGLLKTKQLPPPSPNDVTGNWTSRSTTPNVSVTMPNGCDTIK